MRPWGRRHRRLFTLALFLTVGSLVLLAIPGLTGTENDKSDPRNLSKGEFASGVRSDCIDCHLAWSPPMTDSHIVVNIFPKAVVLNEPTDFMIRVDNPWAPREGYDIRSLNISILQDANDTAFLPLTNLDQFEPQLVVFQDSLKSPASPSLPGGPNVTKLAFRFDVGLKPRALYGQLSLYPVEVVPSPLAKPAEIEAKLRLPGQTPTSLGPNVGTWNPSANTALVRNVSVGPEDMKAGRWGFEIEYLRGDPPEVRFFFNATIYYGDLSVASFTVPSDPAFIPKGEFAFFPFRAVGIKTGTYPLDVQVRAYVYHKHITAGQYDNENYTRYRKTMVEVGSVYIPPDAVAAPGVGAGGIAVELVMGEVTGITGAVLLPPALVLGGTFGRVSRQQINNFLGGAKRRVMFHNTISLGLTAIALLHVILFLWEKQYTVLKGLVWGGLGLLCLLGLALTGYYQVPLIQKYGYRWWRVTHLSMGVLVVVFTVWHTVLDGADFLPVRQLIPEWLTRLNLSDS